MEPFIFEIACIPADKNSLYEYAHITGCAIADTKNEAEIIIFNEIISRSWIVEDVLLSENLTLLRPPEKKIYKEYYLHAAQSEPPCSITIRADQKVPDGNEVRLYPLPDIQNHSC